MSSANTSELPASDRNEKHVTATWPRDTSQYCQCAACNHMSSEGYQLRRSRVQDPRNCIQEKKNSHAKLLILSKRFAGRMGWREGQNTLFWVQNSGLIISFCRPS